MHEPPGRDSSADWAQDEWPGILLRRAKGGEEKVTCVPLDRDLQAALDWAAREYFDPSRPPTPSIPEALLRSSTSLPTSSPPMRATTGRRKPAR